MRGYRQLMTGRQLWQALRIVIPVILILYVAVSAYRFYQWSVVYADVFTGDTRQGVLYGAGRPQAAGPVDGPLQSGAPSEMTAPAWGYTTASGGSVRVVFDPATDRVASVTCTQAEAQPQACPDLYRIGLGIDEGTLVHRLGQPDRAILRGESKVMVYDDIGVEYALKRYQVFSITSVTERGGFFARSMRFVRSLLP